MATSLVWSTDNGVDCLVLQGLSAESWATIDASQSGDLAGTLPVLPSEVVDAGLGARRLQPMAGRYGLDADVVRFVPRFPFLPGTSYAMVVGAPMAPGDRGILHLTFPGVGGAPATEVSAVFPTVVVLPRNALRFYVHFTASMSEGLAADNVHLVQVGTGETLSGAFSPMDFELWDPERRRLTVLLDPARIKQGLIPHREVGYPLHEGLAVELVIECGFRDSAGRPLVAGRHQRYDVGPDVRDRVLPSAWVVEPPPADRPDPVVVRFDRAMDRGLLENCLGVLDPEGKVVGGATVIPPGESSWSLVPDRPWAAGRHHLVVDPVLEDVAGNSVRRVFDRDLDRPDHVPMTAGAVTLSFVVPAA
jgi:hypothetical protein